MSKKQKRLIVWLSIALAFGIIFIGCAVYVGIYYKADIETVEAFLSSESVAKEECDGFTAFIPNGEVRTGFIFYPGGKVDDKAYYPLMHTLAEYGILSIVAEMPFRLAVLDSNSAMDIKDSYPEIKSWYIGGHSLGGAMAAACTYKNENEFKGLVLLGAYSTKDISEKNVAVLSIYGTLDGVMNFEKYEKCLSNMPRAFTEFVIEGGNHAYFGVYGEQKGDKDAKISNAEQIYVTAGQIVSFISLHG